MCVPYGMWGLKTQHVIQSGKENHCVFEKSWSWKNMAALLDLGLSWTASLAADGREGPRAFATAAVYFPDLAPAFSPPAGTFQREAVTQRCCAITAVKAGAARAPMQPPPHHSHRQSSTPKPA